MTELAEGELFIIKIGTASILDHDGKIDAAVLDALVDQVASLHKQGKRIAIVTSGARELGKWRKGDSDPNTAEAMGQWRLMLEWGTRFEKYGIDIGQYLISTDHFDIKKDSPRTGVIHASEKAWEHGAVPIFNENAPFAEEALSLGDNDNATKKLALGYKEHGHRVDGVIFMSVENGTDRQRQMGSGGANEKAKAITALHEAGIPVYVVDGKAQNPIRDIFERRDALAQAHRNANAVVINNGGEVHRNAHRLKR